MNDEHPRRPRAGRDPVGELEGASEPGFLRELFELLKETKKWWLAPILLAILLVGLLVFLSTTGIAPFAYTLF